MENNYVKPRINVIMLEDVIVTSSGNIDDDVTNFPIIPAP